MTDSEKREAGLLTDSPSEQELRAEGIPVRPGQAVGYVITNAKAGKFHLPVNSLTTS